MSQAPVIALLSDFGIKDHYVGSMKAAVLKENSSAQLVDISHNIPPHDIKTGAFMLFLSHFDFPTGTIFLGIIDPGVGTDRKGLIAKSNCYTFILPDNGLLSYLYLDQIITQIFEIDIPIFSNMNTSSTFHGRDIFAPCAGLLSKGIDTNTIGTPMVETPIILDISFAKSSPEQVIGEVIYADHFGNLMTNISLKNITKSFSECSIDSLTVRIENKDFPIIQNYEEGNEMSGFTLIGSSGFLEIAVNTASAADCIGYSIGQIVTISNK